jgi:trimeric autotransporter adhesin
LLQLRCSSPGTRLALLGRRMKTRLLLPGALLLASVGVGALPSPAAAQTISSAANQTFVVGDPSTTASTFTINDPTSSIRPTDDLWIQIPATLSMTWDATVTTVTLTGNAASKVSTAVSYVSGNKVVHFTVNVRFTATDTLIVSGLKFTSFTAVSGPASLQMLFKQGDPPVASDNRTKTIVAKVYGASVSPHALAASQLPSNGTNYTVAFTVSNTGNGYTSYDLLTSKRPGTVITTVSMTGTGVTQGANPDSARMANVLAGSPVTATVTYSVAGVAAGSIDTLVFKGRAVGSATTADSGKLTVTVVRPSMTIAKTVSPTGTRPPGTDLTYVVTITNNGSSNAASVVAVDTLPATVQFKVGSGASSLPSGISVVVDYSNDGGATWTYTPASGACSAPAGYDRCVNRVRWRLQNPLSSTPPNNTGTLQLIAQIR